MIASGLHGRLCTGCEAIGEARLPGLSKIWNGTGLLKILPISCEERGRVVREQHAPGGNVLPSGTVLLRCHAYGDITGPDGCTQDNVIAALELRIRGGQGGLAPVLEHLGVGSLRGVLARSATWYEFRVGKQGSPRKGLSPPVDVVRDLLALPELPDGGVPPLEGIIECPSFTADGLLLDRPGYDPDSRLWYRPAPGLHYLDRVPDNPRLTQVQKARKRLMNLFIDFPFADDPSRANAMALLLMPFIRWLIDGPTPLHLVEAAKASPAWKERDELLQSIPGLGPVTSLTLMAALPELGSLDGGQLSALVGLAPYVDDSGTFGAAGRWSVGYSTWRRWGRRRR